MRARAGARAIARVGGRRALGPTGRSSILLLLVVLAACSPTAPDASAASSGATAGPGASASATDSAAPTAEPATAEPTTEPTVAPTPSPEPTPAATAGPSSSASAGAASRCFGSSDTKDFFNAFAQEVPWPAYCAVLPGGWSVEKGSYRLKDGGRLTISYHRRSDGARIVLDEGAVCAETTPCVPAGASLGQIPFGDRQADLVDAGTAGLVAVVDRTENPAWLLTGTGIGRSDFASIAAKLALIDQ